MTKIYVAKRCLKIESVGALVTLQGSEFHEETTLGTKECRKVFGLTTFGGICASPGVVFVRYAPYICALQVRYARYTRCSAVKKLASF